MIALRLEVMPGIPLLVTGGTGRRRIVDGGIVATAARIVT
jgi:hypothetical protein